MKRRVLTIVLVAVLLFSCASCGGSQMNGVNASKDSLSGEANADGTVNWVMYDTGEMVFSGTGEYQYSNHSIFASMITKITFNSGITALRYTDNSLMKSSFSDCGNLKEVYLPTTVQEIEKDIFDDCTSLTDVYYEGTQVQWTAIKIDLSNYNLLTANIHFQSWKPDDSFAAGKTDSGANAGSASTTAQSDGSENTTTAPTTVKTDTAANTTNVPTTAKSNSVVSTTAAPTTAKSNSSASNNRDVLSSGDANDAGTVTWTAYTNGDIVFSGSGEYCYSTFYFFDTYVKKLTFSNGITALRNAPSGFEQSGFSGYNYLTAVYLPASVTKIEGNLFTNCAALKNVYYEGTQAQWNAINIDSSNKSLLNAKIHYSSWKSQ